MTRIYPDKFLVVQLDPNDFCDAHLAGSMVNPVGKEVVFEQKIFDAAAGGIQHSVVADLEWLAGDLVSQSKTIRCRRFEREMTKAAARLERWLS